MLWLAVHFPELALETVELPAEAPLVILQNNRVCQCNPAAEDAGIVPGTTLATAHSICPGVQHVDKQPEREARRLRRLAHALYRFSSYVCVQAPDCVLMEIGGSLKLFGDHGELARHVEALCAQLGHRMCCRTAQTPWAAIALARSGQSTLAAVPLHEAGLELAEVPPQLVERFHNMGIYTLGPLLELPGKQLGRRFGKALLHYLRQLTGDIPDARVPIRPAAAFAQSLHLLEPLSDREDLHTAPASPMQRLGDALQQWLIAHQLGCEALRWQFHSHPGTGDAGDGIPHAELDVEFARGKQNSSEILHVTLLKLEHLPLPDEVLSVGLEARRLCRWREHTDGLFGTDAFSRSPTGPQTTTRLALRRNPAAAALMDEFQARLGTDACYRVHALAQHVPEAASRAAPARQETRTQPRDGTSPPRPLWLFDPPRPVDRRDLTLLHGPERIQSGWWHETVARDYYVAQHRHGAHCWAFVDADTRWYLHGYFA